MSSVLTICPSTPDTHLMISFTKTYRKWPRVQLVGKNTTQQLSFSLNILGVMKFIYTVRGTQTDFWYKTENKWTWKKNPTLWKLQEERIIEGENYSKNYVWLSFCGLLAVFNLKKPTLAGNVDSQHPCSFICKSYWKWILKGDKERLRELGSSISGRLQQRSLFQQEDAADWAVTVEEICIMPARCPELSNSIKTRKKEKILSKNSNSADALEKDVLNACCSTQIGQNAAAYLLRKTIFCKDIKTVLYFLQKSRMDWTYV